MSLDSSEQFDEAWRKQRLAKAKKKWLRQLVVLGLALVTALYLQWLLQERFSLRKLSRQTGTQPHEVELR